MGKVVRVCALKFPVLGLFSDRGVTQTLFCYLFLIESQLRYGYVTFKFQNFENDLNIFVNRILKIHSDVLFIVNFRL